MGRSFKRAFPVFVLLCLITACTCNNQTTASAISTQGEHSATVAIRNCGATTDYSTVVLLDRPWCEGGDKVLVAYEGRVPIRVRWKTATTLEVVQPPGAKRLSKPFPEWLTIQYATESN